MAKKSTTPQWKRRLKKLWHFLWHDDSAIAWIVSIIVAFVLIKFVLYPVAGLIMGTSLPVVAVVSSSMDHRPIDGMSCGIQADDWWSACGDWYTARNFTEADFKEYPFSNGFWKGDIMVLWRFTPEHTTVGDVIVFESRKNYPIIHRVVDTWQEEGTWYFATKGDHNEDQIQEYVVTDGVNLFRCYQIIDGSYQPSLCGPGVRTVDSTVPNAIYILDETRISENRVIGKAVGRIPLLGWVKIWATDAVGLFVR